MQHKKGDCLRYFMLSRIMMEKSIYEYYNVYVERADKYRYGEKKT